MLNKIFIEIGIVGVRSEANYGVVWLKSLNKNIAILVATFGAPDNLSDQFEDAFFGRKVWERELGISLGDAEGGEFGKIKTFSDHLCADNDVEIAGADSAVKILKFGAGNAIGIKTGDFGIWKKAT